MVHWKNFSLNFLTDFYTIFIGGAMKENFTSFCMLSVFKNSEQQTKIMETVKLEGEKEIKEACIKLYGKLLWTVITVML